MVALTLFLVSVTLFLTTALPMDNSSDPNLLETLPVDKGLDNPEQPQQQEQEQPMTILTREKSDKSNQRPIIGILAQEYTRAILPPDLPDHLKPKKKQLYFPASYVKLVEGGGGRVVPIMSNLGHSYLREMFKSVNGIIFAGGIVNLDNSHYATAASYLYQLAMEENDNGVHFPLWGECLGIQWMLYHAAGSPKSGFRRRCDAYNMSVHINFTKEASKSRLYGQADNFVIKTMKTKRVLPHSHKLCVPVSNFKRLGLGDKYKILGTNYDAAGKIKFVAAVEAIEYPFYALAFHPEKVLYEWWLVHVIAHSSEAVGVAQYHARFLVDEARKNDHKFKSEEDETKHLIYNYVPQYSGKYGSDFEQIYLFDMTDEEEEGSS